MSPTMTIVISAVSAVLSSAGIAAVVQAFAGRRKTRVEAADVLNDSTLEWAQALKTDAREARQEAREARQEAAEMRREAAEMRRQFADLANELRTLHSAILDPGATLTGLKELVMTQNGRP